MADLAIDMQDVWFSYNGKPVLKHVTLKVPQGDFLAIIGPNGGGKTTLIKLILGLMEPDHGALHVFGDAPRKAAGRIGYVPQYVHINLNFPVSVAEVVKMGLPRCKRRWQGGRGDHNEDVEKALALMEMSDYREHKMNALSGGQRQRVIVARALAAKPDMLILDEPTANLDTAGQSDIYELLKALNQTATILVATHDLMVMSSFVKSVACVNRDLMHHDAPEVTADMLDMAYACPVELVAHGLPHRVLCDHEESTDG